MQLRVSGLLIFTALISLCNAETFPYWSKLPYACTVAVQNVFFDCGFDSAISCTCTSDAYMETVSLCIDSHISSQKDRNKAYPLAFYSCTNFTNEDFHNFAVEGKKKARTNVTSAELLATNVTEPFVIPEDLWIVGHQSVWKSFASYTIDNKLGGGLLAYWGFVFLLKFISNIIQHFFFPLLRALDTKFIRKLRKHFVLAPTFSFVHTSVINVWGYTFSIPLRTHTLALIGFSIVHFVVYFTNYPIYTGSLWYSSNWNQYESMIPWRAGVFAIAEVPLLVLFGGRNNFLIWLTGWPLDTFNVFHKWVARWMMLDVFIHAVSYAVVYKKEGYLGLEWSETYWLWGISACFLGVGLVIFSLHFLRSRFYEAFLIFHIILAATFLVSCYYHIYLLEEQDVNWVWAASGIWIFDRVARLAKIAWSGLPCKADAELFEDGVVKLKLDYSNRWNFKAGHYGFLYFFNWRCFWQSHPFTIIDSPVPGEEKKLVLLVRVRTGFTKVLANKLQQTATRSLRVPVLFEGPYGEHFNVEKYDNVTLVAGGIGITGVYGYASRLARSKDVATKRISFIWCTATDSALVWFKKELEFLAADPRFDVNVYVNGVESIPRSSTGNESIDEIAEGEDEVASESKKDDDDSTRKELAGTRVNVHYERFVVQPAIAEEVSSAKGTGCLVCCGPGPLNDEIRFAITKNIENTDGRFDYFEEAFAW